MLIVNTIKFPLFWIASLSQKSVIANDSEATEAKRSSTNLIQIKKMFINYY
jgi:hypothetical protein